VTTQQSPQAFWLENLDGADRYVDWVFDETRPYLGRHILEIGCGTGTYTAMLGATGARVVAMDLDEEFVRAARAATAHLGNVEVRQGDVTLQRWETGFDTIVMFDVLEHLRDDTAMLQGLRDALRPGGRLILKVPAFRWLHGSLDEAVGHYRRYNRRSLGALLSDVGFARSNAWYFNAVAVPGWWLNGRLLRRATPPAGQLKLMNRLVPVMRAVDKVTRPVVGLSLFAVAERP
jgi:SAM-dependent methyltransferase